MSTEIQWKLKEINCIVRTWPPHGGTKPAKKYRPKRLVWNGRKVSEVA